MAEEVLSCYVNGSYKLPSRSTEDAEEPQNRGQLIIAWDCYETVTNCGDLVIFEEIVP